MSGFEIVGVILGAYPVIISLLEAYKATKGGKGAVSLARNLKTEEIIFGEFVHHLVAPNVSGPDLARLTSKVASNSAPWGNATLQNDMRTRLGSVKADNVIEILGEIQELLDSLQQELGPHSQGVELLRRFRSRIRQVKQNLPQSSLKQRLDTLTAYNIQLQRLLADRSLPSNAHSHSTSKPSRRYLRRDPSRVVDLYNAICEGYRCNCKVPHLANFSLPRISDKIRTDSGLVGGWQFELLFAAKASEFDDASSDSHVGLEGLMTTWSRIDIGGETISTSRRVSVTECNSDDDSGSSGSMLDLCILADAVHPGDCSTDRLLGYLRQKERQYQLKSLSASGDKSTPNVKCLDHLLTDERFLLSRRERIRLALSLSHAILSFYSTPWIDAHWTWRDFCIDRENEGQLFATRRFYSDRKEALGPGDHAAPTSCLWAIHGEPTLTRLGFALIELALGKKLAELRPDHGYHSSDPDTLDFLTAKTVVDSGQIMRAESQAYEDVVKSSSLEQDPDSKDFYPKKIRNISWRVSSDRSQNESGDFNVDYQNRFSTTKPNATEESNWVQEIVAASSKDTRKQPWKSTFTNPVDSRFDGGQDLVTVKKSTGSQPNPLCPFNTQGSSLAA
ncbi:MAG: hypothetical protein Q9216_002191 [Gyalolechia sp. 2 TL-2023]